MEEVVAGAINWSGKRVLLTGHTGFKGAWLAQWLVRKGASVIGFALQPPTTPSLFHAAQLHKDMNSVTGDVRDADTVRRVMREAAPELVIHMAAQSLVRPAYVDPVGTYATNVMGTVHVLDAVRHTDSVRAVVNVTSDKCYENREWVWPYRESDPMGGHDPYSNSKGCAELVSASYRSSFFAGADAARQVSIATVRAGNVIGGGDWATDRLIPDLVRGFMTGHPVRLRRPSAVRPWQHVLEPLSGYLLIAERLLTAGAEYAEGWNFGPQLEHTLPVSAVADALVTHWGDARAKWVRDEDRHPHEAHHLSLDWSKARLRLGWSPRWSLDDAVQRTAVWYRSYYSDSSAQAVRTLCDADFVAYDGNMHARAG